MVQQHLQISMVNGSSMTSAFMGLMGALLAAQAPNRWPGTIVKPLGLSYEAWAISKA